MIRTMPHPTMTAQDVKMFREELAKCVAKDFTPEGRAAIIERRARMKQTYKRIIHNNGGKNPIVGH